MRLYSSLRVRLLLLALMAVIPALGLIAYTAAEQQSQAIREGQEEALRLVRLAANTQQEFIDSSRQLLLSLAQLPEVRSGGPAECSALLAEFQARQERYANLGVADAAGDIFCSALPLDQPVNISDRTYFQRAVQSGDFSVGDYQIGRITGVASINFGYPILDDMGRVQRVVFAALDLGWLNQFAAEVALPEGSTLTVIDRNGTVLVRQPNPEDWVGQSFPEAEILQPILERRGEGISEAMDLDGVLRLYAFAPLGGGLQTPDVYVYIGIPKSVVLAPANRTLALNLIGLGLVALLALEAAWVGGNIFLLRPVKALLSASKRLAAGDLAARTALGNQAGEVGQLARAFDDMAEALQTREAERTRAEAQYQNLLESAPDPIVIVNQDGQIVLVNAQTETLFGYGRDELIGQPVETLMPERFRELHVKHRDGYLSAPRARPMGVDLELAARRKNGSEFPVEISLSPLPADNGLLVTAIIHDITERKRAEESVRKSEVRYRSTLDNMLEGAQIVGFDWRYLYVNDSAARHGRQPKEKLLGSTMMERYPGIESTEMFAVLRRCMEERTAQLIENEFTYPDGSKGWVELSIQPVPEGIFILSLDITERKRAEEALRESQRRLLEAEKLANLGHWELDLVTNKLFWWDEIYRIFEISPEEFGASYEAFLNTVHPDDRAFVDKAYTDSVKNRTPYDIVHRLLMKDGRVKYVNERCETHYDEGGKPLRSLGTVLDVTERKQAEERVQRQLQRITSLRNIDTAILGSLDLRLTLSVFLEQVMDNLQVDAAAVLLLNPRTQILEYASSRGFRTAALRHTRLRLGEGHAGRAALERRIVSIPNMAEAENGFRHSPLLPQEGFVSYYAVPLLAKGQVKGILEVFHRSSLDSDQEWFEFLETLAGQAAIALDSATLFDDLQRSHSELTLAYDATIEGWSRALDLRDKETEGHTERVTEMTLRLTRMVGMREEELVHVRRGALLHDIGKMGIPDSILLKAGRLTKEEWVVMKKHPVYAYEMLSPIAYLRPALDIPYCHHEKWDGSGYPRGLKGEEIPLAARIFAIVDVWDALRSDRPYRKAWPEGKALEYIKEQTGKHFDPSLVPIFLDMVGKG